MIQKLLLIHPDVADTMQNHNPHDQKTDPQNDPKIASNPPWCGWYHAESTFFAKLVDP